MSLICQCPAATAITTIPAVSCPENFGQIQKVAFGLLHDATGAINGFSADDIVVLSEWADRVATDDDGKIVVSPFLNSPADSGGDARMTSGGNDDLSGIARVLGGEPVQFTASLRGVPQSTIAILKELMCYSRARNLGVYLFDEYGKIQAAISGNVFSPIPVYGLFVGSKIHGNYDAKDSNVISWYYPDNYSDDIRIITPEFNPLTDLIPA